MSEPVSVTVVNAFVDGESGGNPAGVVLGAERLSRSQKQSVAARVGLSETAFVSPSDRATFKLEFFTPTRQIAHCGHATVASLSLLRHRGLIGDGPCTKETIDGIRRLAIESEFALMEQGSPRYTELTVEQHAVALQSLGIGEEMLADGLAPCVVDTSNAFLLVPLRTESALAGLAPTMDAVALMSESMGLIGYYAFVIRPGTAERIATARMFAPLYGIDEESATGTAAGPLACYLHDRAGKRVAAMQIEQGRWMTPPSPSVLTARLHLLDGEIEAVSVGGRATIGTTLVIDP